MQSKRKQGGITFVETAITTSILAIVLGTVAPSFHGVLERRALDGTAVELATDLQYIRSEAVARNVGLRISFSHTDTTSCYIIHTGLAGQCNCISSAPAQCIGGAAEIKTVHLPAGSLVQLKSNVASMLFHPARGTTSPAGTLHLSGAAGLEIRHVVNMLGRTRSCSPLGGVKGYPVC
jgi:type IV fimbrial biogenesis protein FimT